MVELMCSTNQDSTVLYCTVKLQHLTMHMSGTRKYAHTFDETTALSGNLWYCLAISVLCSGKRCKK